MIQAHYIHPSQGEAKSVGALKHTRGTAADAEGEGVVRCVFSSPKPQESNYKTCPLALKFNAVVDHLSQ